MKLENYTYYYFLGIGGIGMSALARYFKQFEHPVLGYDKTETPLTQKLQTEGISISFIDEISSIPKEIKAENTLVIYTPAIPKDSKLLNFFQENTFTLAKRSVVLGEITKSTKCLS